MKDGKYVHLYSTATHCPKNNHNLLIKTENMEMKGGKYVQ